MKFKSGLEVRTYMQGSGWKALEWSKNVYMVASTYLCRLIRIRLHRLYCKA